MTADLDLANHAITGLAEVTLKDNATPVTPPVSGLTVFTHGDKLQYVNSAAGVFQVATAKDLTLYLKLDGSVPMAGSLNMAGYSIAVVNQLSGGVSSRAADDIVSNSGTATAGRRRVLV